MSEQEIQEAIAYLTRPWSQRRGIETVDRNAEVFLVRVPLEELFNYLELRAIESKRDVMDSEIEVLDDFVLAYQIAGQSWSVIVNGYVLKESYSNYPSVMQPSRLAQISKQFQQPAIRLQVSDTEGTIGYDLFENGELVECFRGASNPFEVPEEFGVPLQQIVITVRQEIAGFDPELLEQTAYFWSRHRQVTSEEIGDVWEFSDKLVRSLNAYDPALNEEYFFAGIPRQGDRYRVQNPGITSVIGYDDRGREREVTAVPNLVRVAYFRFSD